MTLIICRPHGLDSEFHIPIEALSSTERALWPLPYLTWAFFEPPLMEGGGGGRMRAPIIIYCSYDHEICSGIKFDLLYILVRKKFVTSLLLRVYDVVTCIFANA